MTGRTPRRGQAASRVARLVMGLALVLLAGACAPAAAPFVGGFLADNRPHELIYLELTQSGRAVAGALTLVTADADLGVVTDRYDVAGSADRDRLSLTAERFLGRSATLTVMRSGSQYTLTLPTYTGEDIALPLRRSTADELTRALGDWSTEVEDARRERGADAARAATARRGTEELERNLTDVRTSTRRVHDVVEDARVAMTDEQIRVENLAGFVLQLRQGGSRDGNDLNLRCSVPHRRRQAADLVALDSTFAGQRSKLADAIDRLETELATGRRRAAIARDRMRQIKEDSASTIAAPTSPFASGAEDRILKAYDIAAEQARRDRDRLRSTDEELRARIADLLAEGRTLVGSAPDDADCRPTIVLPDPIPEPAPLPVEAPAPID